MEPSPNQPFVEAAPAPEPLQYHRLFRLAPKYRWWKPLVFALVAIVIGFTLTQFVVIMAAIPLMLADGPDGFLNFDERLIALDTQDPLALGVALMSLVVWIPAIMFAAWAIGIKPVGLLWSVALKIRWGLIFRTLGPAVLSLLVSQTIAIVYGMFFLEDETFTAQPEVYKPEVALLSLAMILVLVPLQAAAEELMFRGALMQIFGAWIKNPVLPIILPSVLFMFGHLYDVWALLQVGFMGLVAGWITWRTGGLEAAISLHVVNNLVVFLILVSGVTGDTGQTQETGADLVSFLIQAAGFVFYAFLVVKIADKYHARSMGMQSGGPR